MTHRTPTLLLVTASLLVSAALPAGAANHTVRVINNRFDPRDLTIQAGDSVTWNNEGILHNVRADDDSFRCANGCDHQGGNGNPSSASWSVMLTFNNPGTIPYYCEQHGFAGGLGMAGTLTVEGAQGTPGSLRFSGPNFPVGEGAGSVNVTVQRVGGDDGAASVDLSTSNGTATAPADYMPVNTTLSWADNDDNPKNVSIPIVDDGAVEGQERFNVRLSNATGASLGSPSQATVTINDNDSAPPPPPGEPGDLQLAAETFEADEGAGVAQVTVERVGGASGAVTVQLAASEGTADDSDDFQPGTQMLSWANGDAAPKQATIPLIDDNEDEGVETIKVALSSPAGGAGLGTPANATVAVLDDDGGSLCDVPNGETLCLNRDDRFKVQMSFRLARDESNPRGKVLLLNRDSGLFYFADENNAEVLVKVLNTCSFTNRFWVFYAATTNQEFTLTVTDTERGVVKYYGNEFDRFEPAATILDTMAFETCP